MYNLTKVDRYFADCTHLASAICRSQISLFKGYSNCYHRNTSEKVNELKPLTNCIIFYSENNTISVWNNGKGIPVVEHKVEKVYVPALIFGQLLTSSNYDDDQKKVTGEDGNWCRHGTKIMTLVPILL